MSPNIIMNMLSICTLFLYRKTEIKVFISVTIFQCIFFTMFLSMLFRSSGCFFYKMHYSEHLTLFITISRCYIRYTRKTLFRTSCKIIPISLYSITISRTWLFTNSGHEKKLIPNIRSHIRMFGRGETKANSPLPSIEVLRKITMSMMMYRYYDRQPLIVDEIEF